MAVFSLKDFSQDGAISELSDYVTVAGSGTGNDTYACDVANAKVKNFALTIADTDAKVVTLANVPARCEVFLEITTTAAAAVTWTLNSSSSLTWGTNGGAAPTIAANKLYRILFFTNDSGATWDGFASAGV